MNLEIDKQIFSVLTYVNHLRAYFTFPGVGNKEVRGRVKLQTRVLNIALYILLCLNYNAVFDTEFINPQERKSTPTVYRFLTALISELPLGNFHLRNNSDFSEDVFFV